VIKITRKTLGVLVIKPAKGGAQLTVNAAGNPSQIKVRLDIARQGPPGPAGGGGGVGGSGDLTYTHPQGPASDVWVITHNLGKRPSVTVQDSAFDAVDGDVFYNDTNTLTITFSAAFSGVAYLN
jgi:hypothetical protein